MTSPPKLYLMSPQKLYATVEDFVPAFDEALCDWKDPTAEKALQMLKHNSHLDVNQPDSQGWSIWMLVGFHHHFTSPDLATAFFDECLTRGDGKCRVNDIFKDRGTIALAVAQHASQSPSFVPVWKKILQLNPDFNIKAPARHSERPLGFLGRLQGHSREGTSNLSMLKDALAHGFVFDDDAMVESIQTWPTELDFFLSCGGKASAVSSDGISTLQALLSHSRSWGCQTPPLSVEENRALMSRLIDLGADPMLPRELVGKSSSNLEREWEGKSLIAAAMDSRAYWAVWPLLQRGVLKAESASVSGLLAKYLYEALAYESQLEEEHVAVINHLLDAGANMLEPVEVRRRRAFGQEEDTHPKTQTRLEDVLSMVNMGGYDAITGAVAHFLFVKPGYLLDGKELLTLSDETCKKFYESSARLEDPRLLEHLGKRVTPSPAQMVRASPRALKAMIRHGGNLQGRVAGMPLLTHNALDGRIECCKILLEAGAKVEKKTRAGTHLGRLVSKEVADLLGVEHLGRPTFGSGLSFRAVKSFKQSFTLGEYALWGHRHTVLEGIHNALDGGADGGSGPAETLSGGTILQHNFKYRARVIPGTWHSVPLLQGSQEVGAVVHADGVDPAEILRRAKAVGISNQQQHEDKAVVYVNRYDWANHHSSPFVDTKGTVSGSEEDPEEESDNDDDEVAMDFETHNLQSLDMGRFILVDEALSKDVKTAFTTRSLPELLSVGDNSDLLEVDGTARGIHIVLDGYVEYELGWYVVSDGGKGPVEAFVYDGMYTALEGDITLGL